MKFECEVIEDLLPLYIDNVCSVQSRQMVEEHLRECECCRNLIESTQKVNVSYIDLEKIDSDKVIKKGLKKIRLRWLISVFLVIAILPALFLGWNQYHDMSIHYTNMYEYYIGRAFMAQLENGNYEKAYRYIDVDGLKNEWLEVWFEEDELKNIKEDGAVKFCELAEKIEAAGGIEKSKYIGISIHAYNFDGTPIYQLLFKISFSGKEQMFHINVSNDGVESFSGGGSFLTDPLAQFSIWSEYLWQEYEGCYYDPNLKDYVYKNVD